MCVLLQRYKSLFKRAFESQMIADSQIYSEFNKINISEFLERTRPDYENLITSCIVNEMDCSTFWKIRDTFLG